MSVQQSSERETLTIQLFGTPPAVEDFPTSFADQFRDQLRLVAWEEPYSDGTTWYLKCELAASDPETLATIKDYLQLRFESGELETGGNVSDLFEVLPSVFFVSNVTDEGVGDVEVQLIDRFGRTVVRRVVCHECEITIGKTAIPKAVIEAGRRLPAGTGDFVDLEGKQVLPRDFDTYMSR